MKKVIPIILGLSIMFIFSPVFTLAQTVESLQAQIDSLLQQIKTLQAQLAQAQAVENKAFCHTFNSNFGIGSRVDDTSALLNVLVTEGLIETRSSNFSGIFDETLA